MSFLDAFGLGDPFDPRRMAQPRRQPLPSPPQMQPPLGRSESASVEPEDGQQRFASMVAALAKGDDASDPKSVLAKVERILAGMPRRPPYAIEEDPYVAAATRVPAMSPTDGPDTGELNPNRAPADVSKFVAMMAPHARAISEATGLDPRFVIAKSALETGWGSAAPGNNYFGVKSHGRPGGQTLTTTEVGSGGPYSTRDSFRQYGNVGESARDYIDFLKSNSRYAPLLAAPTLEDQIAAVGQSGYATDPNYAAKLRRIASSLPAFARGGFFSRGQ